MVGVLVGGGGKKLKNYLVLFINKTWFLHHQYSKIDTLYHTSYPNNFWDKNVFCCFGELTRCFWRSIILDVLRHLLSMNLLIKPLIRWKHLLMFFFHDLLHWWRKWCSWFCFSSPVKKMTNDHYSHPSPVKKIIRPNSNCIFTGMKSAPQKRGQKMVQKKCPFKHLFIASYTI